MVHEGKGEGKTSYSGAKDPNQKERSKIVVKCSGAAPGLPLRTNQSSPKTPNKSKALSPCCVKLERIDSDLFVKKYIEMSTRKRPVNFNNVTPEKKARNQVTELCTPATHTEFSQELKKVLNDRNVLTSKTRKKVFEALDEIKSKGDEENRRYKREKALLEIVNSEIKYVHQLEIIINFFLKPAQEKKLLRSEDFRTMFGNILPIYNVNKELLDELEKSSNNVAAAFYELAPFFKQYSVYACEFKNILNILQNARSLNPQFAKFVENQESRPEVQSKLSALLITPIQRVPRYKLLLTQLLRLTKPHEKDFNKLTGCLEKIEEAADHINKIMEDQENMQRLLELQRFLKSGEPNIVKPGRTLVKEGILIKMGTKNAPSEKFYTVLMNDIILFSKMKKEELKINSLKCTSIFPLGKCTVLEILDKGCMKILCQGEELILYHDQFSETKSWITTVRETIESHLSGKKTLRKDSSSRRPVKRKDLFEYHEVGLSPGRPLMKKRRLEPETQAFKLVATSKISGRRPITRTPLELSKHVARTPLGPKIEAIDSFAASSEGSDQTEDLPDQPLEKEDSSENQRVPETSKEVFLFGRPQNGTNPKVGGFFGVVGTSIKRLFGLKN